MTPFRPTGIAVTLHMGDVIVNQASIKAMPVQYPDCLGDIHVSFTQEALLKTLDSTNDVTEVDVGDLTA